MAFKCFNISFHGDIVVDVDKKKKKTSKGQLTLFLLETFPATSINLESVVLTVAEQKKI